MKRIKRDIALFLTLCMVFTCVIPAYAEDVNVPVMTAETFEVPAEAAEVVVPEAMCDEAVAAEAAEAVEVEAELNESEVSEEGSAESAENAEQAAMLGTADPVTYFDWDDTTKQLVEKQCTEYTVIDSSIVVPEGGYVFESNKWYVVTGDITFNNRIENNAAKDTPAHLILTDDHTLTAKGGIHNGSGCGLCIYGQTEGTGGINTPGGVASSSAGIGGNYMENSGSLIINGGAVSVTGGGNGAGIGGGDMGSIEELVINGGMVTATGGNNGGAGIGGGYSGAGGNVTINGGTVNAYGCRWAAGIGGGKDGNGGNVTINGGKIFAQGDYTCAIGNGHSSLEQPGPGGVTFGIRPVRVKQNEEEIDIGTYENYHKYYNPIYIEYQKAGYTVKHLKQKELFKDDYELIGTEALTWFANNDTKATAKEIPGYRSSFSQAKIKEDGTTVIEIRYNLIYYTISFHMNGHGEAVKAISALPGATIAEPTAPSEEGFVFEGWYSDTEFKNPYQFSTMPSKNITLYAKWTAGPFERKDVPYVDENGNTVTVSCIIMPASQKNFVFTEGEWYAVTGDTVIENRIETQATADNPAHLILTDGHSLTAKKGIECGAGKGLVIYGQSEGTGKVTATGADTSNSGIGGCGNVTINGGTINAIGGTYYYPTSMNYVGFAGIGGDGANITINGGTVTATGGDPYGAGIGCGYSQKTGASITINGGTVTATGGNGADGIGTAYRAPNANITVNAGVITAAGGTDNAGIGGDLSLGNTPSELKAGASKEGAEDVSAETYLSGHTGYPYAYLRYSKAAYAVEHKLQKALFSDEYELQEADTDILTGYVNRDTAAEAKDYSGYRALPFDQVKIKEKDTVVEIKYDLIYSTITFEANGHGTAPDPIYAVPGAAITAPEDPSEEYYVFGGWFTDAKCTNQFTFTTMPSEDQTLYAKWTPVQYTITWKDGVKVLRTDKVDYDAMPDYGPDPVKQGYEFVSWWPTVQKVTGDANYNAIFFKPSEKYTVTWMLNDIKLIDTTEVSEGEMPVHANPVIEGYIFIGWKPALAPVTGNVKYTAYFEERGTDKIAVTFNTDGGTFINTQVIDKNSAPERPEDPQKKGCAFEGWYREAGFVTPYEFNEPFNTDMTLYAKWKTVTKIYTITWKDWNGKTLAAVKVEEGGLPVYPLSSKPSRSGYIFTGWNKDITLATADTTYIATYEPKSSGGGGGGGGSSALSAKKAAVTFSANWYADAFGVWRIKNSAGQVVTNAWLCDDAVAANGQNVWYLLTQDGAMLAAGLVQDATGNFYSLETNHDGYFGMLRYTDGYYNCNGQQVYLKFSHEHNGTFGAVINADGLEKLKAIYGVTLYGIGNESAVYTKTF